MMKLTTKLSMIMRKLSYLALSWVLILGVTFAWQSWFPSVNSTAMAASGYYNTANRSTDNGRSLKDKARETIDNLTGSDTDRMAARNQQMRGGQSSPTEGEAQLDQIYQKTQDTLKNPPLTLKEVESASQKGINEVQGAGDVDKMYRPSNSKQATSVTEQVEKALDKVTRDR
jgi:hypothetical protein